MLRLSNCYVIRPHLFAFCLAMVCFSTSHLANAQEAKSYANGSWKWTSELNDQEINSQLTLEVDGNKASGVYKDQNVELPIEKGTVKGDVLRWEISPEVGGYSLHAVFEGKVGKDSIDGKVVLEVDGQEYGTYDWNAERHVGTKEVVGTWNFEFTGDDGTEYTPNLVVVEEDGKLSATMESDEGSQQVEKIEVKNNTLHFEYATKYGEYDLDIDCECEPIGNHLTGILNYQVQGQAGEIKVVAKRKTLSKAQRDLLGTWVFTMITPEGVEQSSKLLLADVGGELAATVTSNGNETEIDEVKFEDGKISFEFVVDHDGLEVDINWESERSGENGMKGTITFDASGNVGEIDFEGKREED